jgi:hypothetical protein
MKVIVHQLGVEHVKIGVGEIKRSFDQSWMLEKE